MSEEQVTGYYVYDVEGNAYLIPNKEELADYLVTEGDVPGLQIGTEDAPPESEWGKEEVEETVEGRHQVCGRWHPDWRMGPVYSWDYGRYVRACHYHPHRTAFAIIDLSTIR